MVLEILEEFQIKIQKNSFHKDLTINNLKKINNFFLQTLIFIEKNILILTFN